MLCGPYLDVADVELCDVATPHLDRGVVVASWLVYLATGRQYPGLCTDTIRPCSGLPAMQMLDYPASAGGGARPIGWPMIAGCGCGGEHIGCGCRVHDTVSLPGYPVSEVQDVTIDGVALDVTPGTGDVVLVDSRAIIRADGGPWPCCQNLARPTTEDGTWSVTYTWGQVPPPDVVLAAEALACQLAAGWSGGECVLPKRLTSLTYEGATMAILDPFQFLDQGRFGIYEVDLAIVAHNPGRLDRTRTMVTAHDYMATEHRTR